MGFFCCVAEWYKIACNHGDFVGYRRFVYFLILAEMVRFQLILRGDVSRVLAESRVCFYKSANIFLQLF